MRNGRSNKTYTVFHYSSSTTLIYSPLEITVYKLTRLYQKLVVENLHIMIISLSREYFLT